ncbi:MAG: ester cyclase [Candidatus Promineifilaceae bacterium]
MDHNSSIQRLYDLINAGDIDGFSQQLADDFVEHEDLPGLPPTKEGVIQYFRFMLAAFPDMRMDVQDSFASGDKAVARLRVSGTHMGDFAGIPTTGNPVSMNIIDITRFGDDGLAREHWGIADQLTMMQQLGVIPAAG